VIFCFALTGQRDSFSICVTDIASLRDETLIRYIPTLCSLRQLRDNPFWFCPYRAKEQIRVLYYRHYVPTGRKDQQAYINAIGQSSFVLPTLCPYGAKQFRDHGLNSMKQKVYKFFFQNCSIVLRICKVVFTPWLIL
jgi:hypothetical protein